VTAIEYGLIASLIAAAGRRTIFADTFLKALEAQERSW